MEICICRLACIMTLLNQICRLHTKAQVEKCLNCLLCPTSGDERINSHIGTGHSLVSVLQQLVWVASESLLGLVYFSRSCSIPPIWFFQFENSKSQNFAFQINSAVSRVTFDWFSLSADTVRFFGTEFFNTIFKLKIQSYYV